MESDKKILIAFLLNFVFSVLECVGGIITGSVAIISDAIHDAGDAMSIGVSYFLEIKSRKQPDSTHTFGYMRYSVLGGFITTVFLAVGSVLVIFRAVNRIINPADIDYNKMIVLAVVGVIINSLAVFFTREGESLNEKAVNLHMLEDVLGWIVVFIGAIVMKFTDLRILDPLMSIVVAIFILVNAFKSITEIGGVFLQKTPSGMDVEHIKEHLMRIEGVRDVHHIHLWSADGCHNYATMHIVTDLKGENIKNKIRHELAEHGVSHTTLEIEATDENCNMKSCTVDFSNHSGHSHHHH